MKRPVISISSSSSDDDDDGLEEEESGSEFSTSSENGDDDDDSESDDLDCDEHVEDHDLTCESEDEKSQDNEDIDDDELCDRVICLIHQGRHDSQELKLMCKAYLRKHGLRLCGTREECVRRIKEHWRLKNGRAEALYPRSSFSINCTGDVCRGDVVLFTQRVYDKFNKVKRKGKILGKRTVAGRIVKESYGAAKQQHTFSVEVLWSKGFKKLPLLSILLVKGRNLYRFKTFRQHWNNEAERSVVLAEKHKRGAAARHVRAMKKIPQTSRTSHTNKGKKIQKLSHQGPPQTKPPLRKDNHNSAKRQGAGPGRNLSANCSKRKAVLVDNMESTHPHGKRPRTVPSNSSKYCHVSNREYEPEKASFLIPYNRVSSSLVRCLHPNLPPYRSSSCTHYSYEQHELHPPQYGLPGYITSHKYGQYGPGNCTTSKHAYRPPQLF